MRVGVGEVGPVRQGLSREQENSRRRGGLPCRGAVLTAPPPGGEGPWGEL